ncbi:MAG: 2-oxoglutarate synthase [Peptococcaceae bacterium BRH_c4b]|nr:MAG: 2-oxoglutarate synthase [Peptococcaceae bacterium BRH_c4b]
MMVKPLMPKCWRKESKPHKFCPGCGHGLALKALGMAIDELGIQDKVVFGCDMGCSLKAWDFFNVDIVQTHHGRTTPVITGLKRANPELIGIAYMGDGGGYAIGFQHLMNSAIRNEKIVAIIINNTNYGMTGGQLAPGTLPGQETETSPYKRKGDTPLFGANFGAEECPQLWDINETGYPIQGPEMVTAIAKQGAYAARGTVANVRQLKDFIKKALRNQMDGNGFSFVEVLSTCPTNWRTDAKATLKYLEEDMTKYFKVREFKILASEGGQQ